MGLSFKNCMTVLIFTTNISATIAYSKGLDKCLLDETKLILGASPHFPDLIISDQPRVLSSDGTLVRAQKIIQKPDGSIVATVLDENGALVEIAIDPKKLPMQWPHLTEPIDLAQKTFRDVFDHDAFDEFQSNRYISYTNSDHQVVWVRVIERNKKGTALVVELENGKRVTLGQAELDTAKLSRECQAKFDANPLPRQGEMVEVRTKNGAIEYRVVESSKGNQITFQSGDKAPLKDVNRFWQEKPWYTEQVASQGPSEDVFKLLDLPLNTDPATLRTAYLKRYRQLRRDVLKPQSASQAKASSDKITQLYRAYVRAKPVKVKMAVGRPLGNSTRQITTQIENRTFMSLYEGAGPKGESLLTEENRYVSFEVQGKTVYGKVLRKNKFTGAVEVESQGGPIINFKKNQLGQLKLSDDAFDYFTHPNRYVPVINDFVLVNQKGKVTLQQVADVDSKRKTIRLKNTNTVSFNDMYAPWKKIPEGENIEAYNRFRSAFDENRLTGEDRYLSYIDYTMGPDTPLIAHARVISRSADRMSLTVEFRTGDQKTLSLRELETAQWDPPEERSRYVSDHSPN